MQTRNRKKLWITLTAVAMAGISIAVGALTGITYKYNYDRYVETNSDKVIDVGNNNKPSTYADGDKEAVYNISNKNTVENPKYENAIDYGPIYDISNPDKNFPYGSSLPFSFLKSSPYGSQNPIGTSFFGVSSSIHTWNNTTDPVYNNQSGKDESIYHNPTGFYAYPSIDSSTGNSAEWKSINNSTVYKFKFKGAPMITGHTYGSSDWDKYTVASYKPALGGSPHQIKPTMELYGSMNMDNYSSSTYTNARTFDMSGNKLLDINISTNPKTSWYYVNTTKPSNAIKYGGAFLPLEVSFYKWLGNNISSTTYSTNEDKNFVIDSPELTFANPLTKPKYNWTTFASVSMTISTHTINTNLLGNDKGYAVPSLSYIYPNNSDSPAATNDMFKYANNPAYFSEGGSTGSIPQDSKNTLNHHGTYYGKDILANVTLSMTPVKLPNGQSMFAPLPYSGTTTSTIKASVENEDKKYTPIEYAEKALYSKDSQNDFSGKVDQDADFTVRLINGYPGNEYGSINTLYLNNVAGTVRWEYNPVTVLKNGLIQPATQEDIKEITISGFKRIPGVTKIADSINVQSPYTLAQDVAKEPYKYYKLIYDLAIRNMPDPGTYIDGGVGDWNSQTLDNLQKIMDVKNVTFNNIGEVTSEGYVNGGYLECDVSLKLYYAENTALITPDQNQPTKPKRIRLYGFQHIEPTQIPNKDIYVGDPFLTPQQAALPQSEDSIKQSIINGMQTKVTPSASNDFRTTEGGTIPVTKEIPDFSKQISIISKNINNLEGTLSVVVSLNTYFAGPDNNGALMSTGFEPVEITIKGYKKVQPTRLNPSITIDTDKTASDAVNQNFTTPNGTQYPYIQFLLMKYKNDAFVGLPDGFNAGSIIIQNAVANNLEGTVTADVSVGLYYDESGNLVDISKPDQEYIGSRPLGQIVIKGFKKVEPTALKNQIISVSGQLEFYNTLASQVDDVRLALLLFQNKDYLFTSYPGLHFSVNSIKILDTYKDNLDGAITVSFALTRYYDQNGEYKEYDDTPSKWLVFDGKTNPNIKIIGFTQVKQTEFVTTNFDVDFQPNTAEDNLQASTTSVSSINKFKDFITKQNILGGSDETPYLVTKNPDKTISLRGFERSAWEILQLSGKTIFQVTPTDIASFILRVLQYAGMDNNNIFIKSSDIGVRILTSRNPNQIINTSDISSFSSQDWYTGSLKVEISISFSDGVWTKEIDFKGTDAQGMNIFNRYVPLPIYTTANPTDGNEDDKNLATSFTADKIESFIYENIDQILNGSFNAKVPSGKPINFSPYNISVSNVLYNNNKGEVTATLTIDNFYLPSGNLSTDPSSVDGENPAKTLSTTITFSGFKKQKSTEFKSETNLQKDGATPPFTLEDNSFMNWGNITADKFWEALSSTYVTNQGYDPQQFIFELITGTGKLWDNATIDAPNQNRILYEDAQIPKNFSKDDVISYNATWSNINGRLDLTFKIKNYYDSLGNLEMNIPKPVSISIFGFKSTQASIIAGSSISSEDSTNIYIKGSFDVSASLVTNDYIIDNILNKTSGVWPPQKPGEEDTTNFDFLSNIDKSTLNIVYTNNNKGEVKATFRLKNDVNIYDSEGNEFTLSKNYTYNLFISGFDSSLMIYVGISILIIFILFILIPAIIILVKRSRAKSRANGKISDLL